MTKLSEVHRSNCLSSRYLVRSIIFSFLTCCVSGCTIISHQVQTVGNYIGQTVGLVAKDTDYSPDEQRQEALKAIGPEQEYHIGRAVAARVLQRYASAQNSELQRYVQLVGHALTVSDGAGSPFGGYHFRVIESEDLNAISAPGGYIFVTTGFLKVLENEDQLAAILSHEISHVRGRHGLKAIEDNELLSDLSGMALASGGLSCVEALSQATFVFSRLVDGVVDTLLESGYSKEFEYQADLGAYTRLEAGGYKPQAIYEALKAIETQTEQAGGWFGTHPSVAERIASLNAEFTGRPIPLQSDAGFEARTNRARIFLKGL